MSLMGDGREYAIWLDLLMPALQEESVKAEQTARLFHSLLVEIENNPQGSLHAIECLETALAVAFSFTPIYPTSHILLDRKSTRLNSSHVSISYAVFCLK